jgi:hypothetical protein
MYALLLLDATTAMLGRPARASLLPQIVPRDVFHNAVTWNSSLQQIISVVGPALGGLIIVASLPAAYIICAVSSLLFIALLTQVKFHRASKASEKMSLATLLAGIHFVWRTRLILGLMSLDMFAVLLGGAVYLPPNL